MSSRISFFPSLNSILFPFASYSTYFDWLIPPASILVGGFVDDVFSFAVSEKMIETWIGLKRDEIDQARLAPTPLEYELYFHI